MNTDAVTLYLTVCNTEEASNIIGILTDEGKIISANITAESDTDHSFDHHIAEDTEVTICITVEEAKLDHVMQRIGHLHNDGSNVVRVESDHPRTKAYSQWTSTKFFPDNY